MPITIRCPQCAKSLTAKDEHRGKRVKCPCCGKPVGVPAGFAVTAGPQKERPVATKKGDAPVTTQESSVLEQEDGSKCPKCGVVFFANVRKCGQCGGPVEPAKYYTRFCLERVLFILTAIVASFLVTPLVTNDPEARRIAPLIMAFAIPGMYFAANYFMGIGGLTERFADDAIPPRAHLHFSWRRYFSELFRIVGVFLAAMIFAGAVKLLR